MNMRGQLGGATTASFEYLRGKTLWMECVVWGGSGLAFSGGLAWLLVDPNQQLTVVPKRKGLLGQFLKGIPE